MNRVFRHSVSLAVLAASSPALAEEAAHAVASEGDSIIVTATRAPLTLDEIPAAIAVLDKDAIDRAQDIGVTELLLRTPGISISRNGGYGTATSLRIRGAESDHSVVVIDGVKLNDPSSTGGGFNFMGELVPYWYRLTNVPRFIKDQQLASELNVINIFGSLRYQTRTALHYPEVWPVCVDCIQRGITVGTQSDALFLAKIEDAFHLPLQEARAALGVRGAVDVDTDNAGAFWAEREALAEA